VLGALALVKVYFMLTPSIGFWVTPLTAAGAEGLKDRARGRQLQGAVPDASACQAGEGSNMPKSIPDGLTRDHVLRALADLDAGIKHPFGPPTGYELEHEGNRYPPKAVVGLAWKYFTGSPLGPDDFSGGEAPGQANHVLRHLGFEVIPKVDTPGPV